MSTQPVSLQASPLTFRDELVSDLRKQLSSGDFALRDVPQIVKLVVGEDMWRERIIRQTGEIVRFERFADFVTTDSLEGLGSTLRQLHKLCADDPEALDLLDRASQERPGPKSESPSNRRELDTVGQGGTTSRYALRCLRKDRPDLHGRVLLPVDHPERLSPHAAMVQAGFRVKTATIPIDSDKTVDMLARHFDPEKLEAAAAKARARLEGQTE